MLSSNDVSQMFAAQNQMFMGQGALAQQVGVAPPSTSLASWGAPNANLMNRAPHLPGIHAPPPAFSYAPHGMGSVGYGAGNRFGASAMSAIGASASIAGTGIGLASMIGPLGKAMPFLDPFSMWGAARGLGMGVMGSAGAAAIPIAAGMAIGHGVQSFVHGGQQQAMINSQLGQNFNFFNPMSRSSMGFSRDQAQAIGDQIRSLAHIPELMTSVGELTRLIPQLKQAGVMSNGMKDAQEFNRRFKEAVSTIKDMSKVLGTTMEEAAQFFAHSRSIGMLGKGDQIKNALNAQFTTGVTGMSMGQFMQMQQTGAGMARGFGAAGSRGARALTNMTMDIGLAQREGLISEGMIEEMTGLSGAEGARVTSERMTQAMMGLSRTAVGRLTMAGLADFDEQGNYSGLNKDLVRRMRSGAVSLSELKSRASRLTHKQKISWTHRNQDIAVDMAGELGPGAMGMFIQDLVSRHGDEAGKMILARNSGLSATETDFVMQMANSTQSGDLENFGRRRMQESAFREQSSPDAIMRRIKTRMHNALTAPIEQKGAEWMTKLSKIHDEFIDDLVGRHIQYLSKEGADSLAKAMSGAGTKEIQDMFAAEYGVASQQQGSGNLATVGKVGKWMFALSQGVSGLTAAATGGLDWVEKGLNSGSGGGSLRDSEFVASLLRTSTSTGRTDAGQRRHIESLLGVSGAGADALLSKMASGGSVSRLDSDRLGSLRGVLQDKILGSDEYMAMSDQNRFDVLRRFVEGEAGAFEREGKSYKGAGGEMWTHGPATSQQKAIGQALRELKAAGAANPVMELIAQTGVINMNSLVSGMNTGPLSAAERDRAMRGAKDGLSDLGLNASTISLLESSSSARSLFSQLGSKGDEIRNALFSKDDATASRMLSDAGFTGIRTNDVDAIRKAYQNIYNKKVGAGELGQHLDTFENVIKAKDLSVIREAFDTRGTAILKNAADGKENLSAKGYELLQGLGNSMKDFASSTRENGMDRFKAIQASGRALFDYIGNVSEQERGEIFARSEGLASAWEGASASAKGLRRGMTRDEIMRKMGVSGAAATEAFDAAGFNPGKTFEVDKEQVKKITSIVAGLKMSGNLAAAGQMGTGQSVDDALLGELKDLKKTHDVTNTLLANVFAKQYGGNPQDLINNSYNKPLTPNQSSGT